MTELVTGNYASLALCYKQSIHSDPETMHDRYLCVILAAILYLDPDIYIQLGLGCCPVLTWGAIKYY